MMFNGYVKGLLDNDLYNFTMQNVICQKYPNVYARCNLFNRDNRKFPGGFGKEVKRIIGTFREFKLTKLERHFLKVRCPYLNPVYLDFLKGYQFNPDEVKIEQQGTKLICLVEGPLYRIILWDVPLMAVISQLYFEKTGRTRLTQEERRKRNCKKFMSLQSMDAPIIEFGTRRRYSYQNHHEVVRDAKEILGECLIGTSNVQLAMEHDLVPKGTNSHLYYKLHAALYGYRMANEKALDTWIDVYRGSLGTALTDTFTSDVFFRTFNHFHARLFDCLRHDSSSPFIFITKSIEKYRSLNISPSTKTLLFSDSINSVKRVEGIRIACRNIINDMFGIGTWLTNDVDVEPLNIVIKLIGCKINGQWINTVKLSDDKGKNTGLKEEVALCKATLGII